jgi:glycine/D-amino acid oxidase-like deaminating enzyme
MARRRIMVVGAGAFGGWTALQLVRRGADVVLVEAWEPGHPRSSSTGDTRVIRSFYGPEPDYLELVTEAFSMWRECNARAARPLYHRTGALWMFGEDDSYARQSLPRVTAAGFNAFPLEVKKARARYPQICFDGVRNVYVEAEAGYLEAESACRSVVEWFCREGGTY